MQIFYLLTMRLQPHETSKFRVVAYCTCYLSRGAPQLVDGSIALGCADVATVARQSVMLCVTKVSEEMAVGVDVELGDFMANFGMAQASIEVARVCA